GSPRIDSRKCGTTVRAGPIGPVPLAARHLSVTGKRRRGDHGRLEYMCGTGFAFPCEVSLTDAPSISRSWLSQRLLCAHDLPAEPGVLRYVHAPDFVSTPAAVLVPLINRPAGITVMFT